MDCREKFLTDIGSDLTDLGYTGTESRKIVYLITSRLENYEITPRETSLAPVDNESEGLLKLYRGTLLTEGRSEKTVKTYIWALIKFKNEIGKPLRDVGSFDIRVWLAKKQQEVSMRTCENYRLYISGFYSWLINEEIIDKNPMAKLKPAKYIREEKKSFSVTEIDSLKSNCDTNKLRAMVELLLSSGVRVEEFTKLDLSDIDFHTGEVTVREGKGGKPRKTFISEVCSLYLKKYLDERTDDNPSLFVNRNKKRLTCGGVRHMLKELGNKSGVEDVHPHRFRRTFATTLHYRGMDIRTIQLLMGHSNINTTTQYLASDEEKIKIEYKRHA